MERNKKAEIDEKRDIDGRSLLIPQFRQMEGSQQRLGR
jgi:hypothetical protein